jgi:hypothetical protein
VPGLGSPLAETVYQAFNRAGSVQLAHSFEALAATLTEHSIDRPD